MVKEYQMTGSMPIVVNGYGRVEPRSVNFTCEMEAEQEKFFLKIHAVAVVREVPDAKHEALAPPPIDGVVEFEGRVLQHLPSSWPHRDPELDAEPIMEDPE